MVMVVSTSWFPTSKSSEVGKKYLEILKQFPPDKTISKLIVPVGVRTTSEGMKAFTISEIKEGKLKEFMDLAYKQILIYSEIEGYKTEMEFYMSGAEALPLVGLKMPEL
ncbi:MAG TPA: hypothetical protein VMV43_00900 [Candidatus Nanopelagicaceae bacterium]|nr:hypothetical protein [Candidatus Nanopelagicaceae bacterium]